MRQLKISKSITKRDASLDKYLQENLLNVTNISSCLNYMPETQPRVFCWWNLRKK